MLTGVDDAEVKDKYEKYLREGIISIGSSAALEWWINTAQRTRFPLLLRMAIDILSIQNVLRSGTSLFYYNEHHWC